MLFIHNTVSLCDHCYRHVPAVVYEHDNKILMKKHCPEHGDIDSVVEIDTEFYYSLEHHHGLFPNQLLNEITDKCQLECPHCYHLPDNKTIDRPLDQVVEQMSKWPEDCIPHFAGAEPALRKDFVELIQRTKELNFVGFAALTNGVRFADREFAQQCFDSGLTQICFGLNHHSYQGKKIHAKQLQALKNLLDIGYTLSYVGYTIESLDDLPEILYEIHKINHPNIRLFRIRCGSFVGRSSDKQRSYLSNMVARVQQLLKNKATVIGGLDDNPYHVMMQWNNITLRLIQWPDVTNIDLEELRTGPWCEFYDGPITNFVHQVITRDAYVNMSLPKLDLPPVRYQYQNNHSDVDTEYWKHNWAGPVPFDTFKFEWPSDLPKPVMPQFRIHSQ